jgi:hypothetical protein
MPQLVDQRGTSLGILSAVEGVQLRRDHVQGVIGEEELRQKGPIVPLKHEIWKLYSGKAQVLDGRLV